MLLRTLPALVCEAVVLEVAGAGAEPEPELELAGAEAGAEAGVPALEAGLPLPDPAEPAEDPVAVLEELEPEEEDEPLEVAEAELEEEDEVLLDEVDLQVRSYRGALLRSEPTMPNEGLGVEGTASWRVYQKVLTLPMLVQATSCQ